MAVVILLSPTPEGLIPDMPSQEESTLFPAAPLLASLWNGLERLLDLLGAVLEFLELLSGLIFVVSWTCSQLFILFPNP